MPSVRTQTLPSRTHEDTKNLSLSKDKDAKSESHVFFKGFIKHIHFCEMPEEPCEADQEINGTQLRKPK